ncbi:MAG: Rieske 2Fe-2S domain-containing protein [Candidatus Andeanibacterium colombiense]|uniref:Rieske 2Fe-2S domain-containing protein n=1 Tax=Candidatus Andeanibacterium colombiense TaxID=3121345 RepID=A0AAJ5X633_9SPHN|nr:MAG: Rieske 2Fe-2S domain-containing protein [Sphingomonadaceae bacterium]
MLSHEDNELLCRIGSGTPMGELMRRFWMPAVVIHELKPDGRPVRIRLLGEDLVCFMDSEGKVGLLGENCPHRGTSLALGVNGECGLRCVFHGWKFDVTGQCLDTPAEPENSKLAKAMKAKAYPTRVAGGMVWTYMGPKELEPEFPVFPWFDLPEGQVEAFRVIYECNYSQALEGAVDSSHAGVLHRDSPWTEPAKWPHEKDLRPKLEVEFTRYGMRYCAVRNSDDGRKQARMTQIPLPFYTFIPPDGEKAPEFRRNRRLINAFVPRDDYTTWHIQFFYDPGLTIDRAHREAEANTPHDSDFFKTNGLKVWYNQDAEMMRTRNMTGIDGVALQDHAVSETMGAIADRTKEHLGRSDMAVVAFRRMMLRAVRRLQETGELPEANQAIFDWNEITAETFLFPPEQKWQELQPLAEHLQPVTAAA